MEVVTQDEVIRHWLRTEQQKPDSDSYDVAALSEPEAVDNLLRLNPGAAAFVWRDAPIDWYHLELSRQEFLDLHVVPGPEQLYFRALAPDNTIRGAARRIRDGDPDSLTAATGVDVGKVLTLHDDMPAVVDEPFVLATRQGCTPWTIADGNYRAAATALAVIESGDYTVHEAYLGVGTNSVRKPLRERICGLVRRVLPGRRIRRVGRL